MKENELKCCPFCGGKATLKITEDHHVDYVSCKCGIAVYGNSPAEAIDLWNRRKTVPSKKFEVDDDGYADLENVIFYTEECPFCGRMPNLCKELVDEDKEVDVVCCNCGATMYGESSKDAINSWNYRNHKGMKMKFKKENIRLPEVDLYAFKVKDYTTILYGQRVYSKPMKKGSRFIDEGYFYVQRGDGTIYKYENYRVQWFKRVYKNKGVRK